MNFCEILDKFSFSLFPLLLLTLLVITALKTDSVYFKQNEKVLFEGYLIPVYFLLGVSLLLAEKSLCFYYIKTKGRVP